MFNIKNFAIAFLMMASVSFCSQVEAKTIKFAQISDIHYTVNGENVEYSSRNWKNSNHILNRTIKKINAQDLDFVVFLGDNIDKSRSDYLEAFLKTASKLNKPFYICLGNHDAYKISGIPKEDYAKLVNKYNHDHKYNDFNYTFSVSSEILGMVVDGSFPVAPNSHGVINQKTMAWIDKTLDENKDKKVIIFQHFPLIEPYEKKTHTLVYKDRYEKMLSKHKNIIAVCSGHYHEPKVSKEENGIYHISAPSLGVLNSYQIVEIKYEDKMFKEPSDFKFDVQTLEVEPVIPRSK